MAVALEMTNGKRAIDLSASPAVGQMDVASTPARTTMIRTRVRPDRLPENTGPIVLRRRRWLVRPRDQSGVLGAARQLDRSLVAFGS